MTHSDLEERSSQSSTITWSFQRTSFPGPLKIQGTLTVTYKVLVVVNGGNFFNQKNKINCEIVGKVTGPFLQTIQQDTDCVRLIPMVTYKWEPSPTTFQIAVNKISAFYRLEFGALEPGGRGLVHIRWRHSRLFTTGGIRKSVCCCEEWGLGKLIIFTTSGLNKDCLCQGADQVFLIVSICIGDGIRLSLMY